MAEAVASAWLMLKGYALLARRARTSAGELDLVALKGGVLVVVEVKARPDPERAFEAIAAGQKRRLARAAETWARRHGFARLPIRFDLVAITPWRWPRHIEGAFLEGDH